MEWSRDMSAGHRQRGPQEGHSTMEEGEEMRDVEDEGKIKRSQREHEREEVVVGGGRGTGVEMFGCFFEFQPNWRQ